VNGGAASPEDAKKTSLGPLEDRASGTIYPVLAGRVTMPKPMNVRTKKLLVATVGVASVSYLACSSSSSPTTAGDAASDAAVADEFVSSGNLVGPLADGSSGGSSSGGVGGFPDASAPEAFMTSGNLVAPLPEASPDAPADAAGDAQRDAFIGSGNLVAPLPDAGRD
jgi:hypothetical protein